MDPASVGQPRVDKRHPHRPNLQFDILPDGDLRHDYRRFATCCCRPSNRDVIKGGVDETTSRSGSAWRSFGGLALFGFAALAVLVQTAVWPELLGAK
jgi:hypothetical protein